MRHQNPIQDRLRWAIRLFCALVLLYTVHRLSTFGKLGGTQLSLGEAAKAFVVGSLSDVWIAGIAAMLFLIAAALFRISCQKIFVAWYGILATITAIHQGYIAFFGHQFLPLHFSYLFDYAFLKANAASAFDPEWLAMLLVGLSIGVACCLIIRLTTTSTTKLALLFAGIIVGAGVAHQRNIHFRVQWFVPEQLQMQVLERVHFQIVHYRKALDLDFAEVALLARRQTNDSDYESLVMRASPTLDDLNPVGQALVRRFHSLRERQEKPAVIVVLMESQRPSETGFYHKQLPSLTPHFDALANGGIAYTQAFAVSNVTRGAQEAVFCGYRGSASLSLMRGRSEITLPCLPDQVDSQTAVLWLHGGDGRFDRQAAFWQEHAIQREHMLTADDFPISTPRTGWGVGDRELMLKSVDKMAEIRALQPARDQMLAMILTVTNHIPWSLVDDFESSKISPGSHPSHLTTAYADAALGDLVERLKTSDRWHQTILIVLSDHGNTVSPAFQLYHDKKHREAYLASHITMALGGGIVESELNAMGKTGIIVEHPVSQASVAPLLAAMLQATPGRYMAESLFSIHADLPILTDLGRDVFEPTTDAIYTPEIFKTRVQSPQIEHLPQIYFRALLKWIDNKGLKKPKRFTKRILVPKPYYKDSSEQSESRHRLR